MRTTSTLLYCFVFAITLHVQAQNAPASASPLAACGNEKVVYDVSRGESDAPIASPGSGKALVYIVEVFNLRDKGRLNRPTVRHGLNGAWLGATQGFTYLNTEVNPGEQHLCSHWQSHFSALSDQVSLYNFDAIAGQTYFFRVQIQVEGGPNGSGPVSIDLEPVSEDEGRFLVSQAARSMSKPKS